MAFMRDTKARGHENLKRNGSESGSRSESDRER